MGSWSDWDIPIWGTNLIFTNDLSNSLRNVRTSNDLGRFVFIAEFSDESSGIFLVPEPFTALLLATGLAGFAAARRRQQAQWRSITRWVVSQYLPSQDDSQEYGEELRCERRIEI
jgi:hypothetical protein